MSRNSLIKIIAFAPKIALRIAATGPQTLFDVFISNSDGAITSLPKIDGGLTMKIIPNSVRPIVNILNKPHGSPKKIRENIATKTGVEKIITELKKRIKMKFNHRFIISLTCHQAAYF